jgi:hypothetical protein
VNISPLLRGWGEEETSARLKALGFEIISWPGSSTLVIGRLPIEKLEALVALKAVHFIAPHL